MTTSEITDFLERSKRENYTVLITAGQEAFLLTDF